MTPSAAFIRDHLKKHGPANFYQILDAAPYRVDTVARATEWLLEEGLVREVLLGVVVGLAVVEDDAERGGG